MYPYLDAEPANAGGSLMPLLPLVLSNGEITSSAVALLDSGAAVNVLPYSLGEKLGLVRQNGRTSIVLSGNLARIPARGVVISAAVGSFPLVRLAFAWSQSDDVRLILGQANFFMEFDVCFFRAQARFEITPRNG